MNTLRTLLLLVVSSGTLFTATSCSAAGVQVLYIIENRTLVTYDVDFRTGTATRVGSTPVGVSPIQMFSSPNTRFLYLAGSTAAGETFIFAYPTDARGVPAPRPAQRFLANQLSQFVVHPSGKYGYALFSYLDSNGEFNSSVELFKMSSTNGFMVNTHKVQATYGPSFYLQESLFGTTKDGRKLYDGSSVNFHSANGTAYSFRLVDPATGDLGTDTGFIAGVGYADSYYRIDFSDDLIVDYFNAGYSGGPISLDVYPNSINPMTPLIDCTVSMLTVCGDEIAGVKLDPSAQNIFISDLSLDQTTVAHIDLVNSQLTASATVAGTPRTYFNPDGSIFFAASDYRIDIYRLQSTTGTLVLGPSIPLAPGSFVFASERR
ncbi:MAG TPA: hypothetical protein VFA68_01025 [Terriglobales bacterium]|nr:hypothetical protein [Terriglobales bacterium]